VRLPLSSLVADEPVQDPTLFSGETLYNTAPKTSAEEHWHATGADGRLQAFEGLAAKDKGA